MGSLHYKNFIAEVHHKVSTSAISVQMMIEVENNNDFMLKFNASLNGHVNGKTTSPEGIERLKNIVGYVAAKSTATLKFDRIFDVPATKDFTGGTPFLSGVVDYKVQYYPASSSQRRPRTTARIVAFEMWLPPTGIPGQITRYDIKTSFYNEVEK